MEIDDLIVAVKKIIQEHKEHKIDIWISANEHVKGIEELMGIGEFVQQKNLRVGDIWIRINGKLAFVFERKTIQDACASMGERNHHQKFGMRSLPIPAHRVIYIYEGEMISPEKKQRFGTAQYPTLVSSQVNSVVRDGLSMLSTRNKKETVFYVFKIAAKVIEFAKRTLEELKNYPETSDSFNPLLEQARKVSSDGTLTPTDEEVDNDYAQAYKVVIVKRALRNPRAALIASLQVIPGVSARIACAVVDKYGYKSSFDFCQRATVKDLREVEVPPVKGTKKRPLGPAKAKDIIRFMNHVVFEEESEDKLRKEEGDDIKGNQAQVPRVGS